MSDDGELSHARAVKAFVRRYHALEEDMVRAQSRNDEKEFHALIDRKRQMERRVRFVEGAP